MDNKGIIKQFNAAFSSNPEYYGRMLSVFNKHKCHISSLDSPELIFYPFVCQLWEGRDCTCIEEDLICAYIWQKVIHNKITYKIQETPKCFKDDQIKENDNLVKSYVEHCKDSGVIAAEFIGGNQGADGFVEFSNPPNENNTIYPLEIGYIKPTQFYYHITHSKCIARLPYDSDYIVYFENLEKDAM